MPPAKIYAKNYAKNYAKKPSFFCFVFLAEKENIIVVQISNFAHHKGGATKSIKIGNWENISNKVMV